MWAQSLKRFLFGKRSFEACFSNRMEAGDRSVSGRSQRTSCPAGPNPAIHGRITLVVDHSVRNTAFQNQRFQNETFLTVEQPRPVSSRGRGTGKDFPALPGILMVLSD